jgi:SAM-dependent methyltransferase
MRLTALSRGEHLEPPPWLYARLARGSLMRLIYRRLMHDLTGSLPPGTRLLDVGTGPGYLLGYLARDRPDLSLWGLDFSPDMIRRARQRPMVPRAAPQWLVADACRLPFATGVFGQVVTTFSFHIWPCPVAGLKIKSSAGTMPCPRMTLPTSSCRRRAPGELCSRCTTFSGGPNSSRPDPISYSVKIISPSP